MRLGLSALLAALCLVGCVEPSSSGDDGYWGGGGGGWGSGWGGGGGPPTYGCQADSECGGQVCARTGECLPASSVRLVRTEWTLDGAPASDTTCSAAPRLAITFSAPGGEQFGYTPVPCKAGVFTIDKFPTRFTEVQLARDGDYSGGDIGTFDPTSGVASLDLPY